MSPAMEQSPSSTSNQTWDNSNDQSHLDNIDSSLRELADSISTLAQVQQAHAKSLERMTRLAQDQVTLAIERRRHDRSQAIVNARVSLLPNTNH